MMNTVQQMSSFEFQMVCVVRLLLASVCGFAIGIERTNPHLYSCRIPTV